MTRAREKLYIVGNLHNPESKIAEIYSRFYTGYEDNSVALSLSKSFLQWAILTAIQHPDYVKLRKDLGVMNCISRSTDSKIDFQIVDPPEIDDINIESENEKPNADKIMLHSIKEKVSYEYPYDNIANIPIQYSASRIDKDSEILYIATENPAFMGKDELTPAQRGTLAHTFMEKCDFNLAKESVEQEIARLKQDGVFTEVEAQAINVKSVSTFFESMVAPMGSPPPSPFAVLTMSGFKG